MPQPHIDTDFHIWARNNQFDDRWVQSRLRPGESCKPTHTLLTGGTLYIPSHANAEFLQHVAADIVKNPSRTSISEFADPDCFKFFLDFDAHVMQDHVWTDEMVETIVKVCIIELHNWYPCATLSPRDRAKFLDENGMTKLIPLVQNLHSDWSTNTKKESVGYGYKYAPSTYRWKWFHAVVCRADTSVGMKRISSVPNMALTSDPQVYDAFVPSTDTHTTLSTSTSSASTSSDEFVKVGLHIVFPLLFVHKDQALNLRAGVAAALNKCFDTTQYKESSWCEIVDASVYSGNPHLRLPLCHKYGKCPTCTPHMSMCTQCNGYRKCDLGRPYLLSTIINGTTMKSWDEAIQKYERDQHGLLMLCSLRMIKEGQNICPGFQRYLHAPRGIDNKDGEFAEDRTGLKESRSGCIYSVAQNSDRWYAVVDLVRNYDKVYKNIDIRDIKHNRPQKKYLVRVSGIGSQYCFNVGRDHKSNSIYFQITAKGIVQKCFCRCNTKDGRRFDVLCKMFSSKSKPLPTATQKLLLTGCSSDINVQIHEKMSMARAQFSANLARRVGKPGAHLKLIRAAQRKPSFLVPMDEDSDDE